MTNLWRILKRVKVQLDEQYICIGNKSEVVNDIRKGTFKIPQMMLHLANPNMTT